MIGTAIADTDIMAVQPLAQPNAELPLTSSCQSPLRLGRPDMLIPAVHPLMMVLAVLYPGSRSLL